MNEIAAKLGDALSMFWQSLDQRERQLVLIGCAWLVALAVWTPIERRRRERERELLAEAVGRRLAAGAPRG